MSAIRKARWFQCNPPFSPPPHIHLLVGGGGGTRDTVCTFFSYNSAELFLIAISKQKLVIYICKNIKKRQSVYNQARGKTLQFHIFRTYWQAQNNATTHTHATNATSVTKLTYLTLTNALRHSISASTCCRDWNCLASMRRAAVEPGCMRRQRRSISTARCGKPCNQHSIPLFQHHFLY